MSLTATYTPPHAAHTARSTRGASRDGLGVAFRLSVADVSPDADVLALALHIADACAELPPTPAASLRTDGRTYASRAIPPVRDLSMRKCAAAYADRTAHLPAASGGAVGTVRPMTLGAKRSALVSQALRSAGLPQRVASGAASLGEYVGGVFVSGRQARVGLLSVVGGGKLPAILVNVPRRGLHAPQALYVAVWGGGGGGGARANMNTPLTVYRVTCTVALADAIDPPPAHAAGRAQSPPARAYTVTAYDIDLDEGDATEDDNVDDDDGGASTTPKSAPVEKKRRTVASRRRQRAPEATTSSSTTSSSKRARTEDADPAASAPASD